MFLLWLQLVKRKMREIKMIELKARRIDIARVVQVIEVVITRGAGTPEDIVRKVVQYWDFEGRLLSESDSEAGLNKVENG